VSLQVDEAYVDGQAVFPITGEPQLPKNNCIEISQTKAHRFEVDECEEFSCVLPGPSGQSKWMGGSHKKAATRVECGGPSLPY